MYSENPAMDAYRFTRATLMNLLARYTPDLYGHLKQDTGRGSGLVDPVQTADYFLRCYDDYLAQLGLNKEQAGNFLNDKVVLEYGPGDILGLALLMYAHGAKLVQCVDRFPLERATSRNLQTYLALLDKLAPAQRARANQAFNIVGDPASGFNPELVRYSVTRDGLINQPAAYDLIISRSVLEHVNCLEKTIADMAAALRPDGITVHKVDLKSHGLDRYLPLDFLTWPDWLYQMMNSHKGSPNRWRVDTYKDLVVRHGLRIRSLAETGRLEPESIERIRSKLPARFRDIPTDELSWLGFWMVLEPG